MISYSKLNSLLLLAVLLVIGCSNPYKNLVHTESPSPASIVVFKPKFDRSLYKCHVNGRFIFKKYHLSGLLLFKQLENGTVRAIFQNEMGLTFFDFEWSESDSFKLNKIIAQLNKPSVVRVLKKDMELLLMKGLDWQKEKVFASGGKEQLHRLNIEGGYAYYVLQGDKLVRIENAGEKSKVVTINLSGKQNETAMPEKVFIDHHKANFTIELNKIDQDVDE